MVRTAGPISLKTSSAAVEGAESYENRSRRGPAVPAFEPETIIVSSTDGRDHNHHGFTMWLVGGGVKGGMTYGETDEFGFKASLNKMHVHDLHATILHLLGLDHKRLTFRHAGRDFRLTDVYGRIVREILS